MAHVTGGGITENLPRVLPGGTAAVVDTDAWEVPSLFRWLQQAGDVPSADMRRTFNMGIGLILVTAREHADSVIQTLSARGGTGARVIGQIVTGVDPVVTYVGRRA